jgi:hypothetical protein
MQTCNSLSRREMFPYVRNTMLYFLWCLFSALKKVTSPCRSIDALDAKVTDICHRVNNHQAMLEWLESSRENNQGLNFMQFNYDTKVRGTPKPHKVDFLKFDGKGEPLSFIHCCELFFFFAATVY